MHKYLPSWLSWSERCDNTASGAISSVSVSHTTSQEKPEVRQLIANILRNHTELSSLSDLRPCEEVNTLFGELVGLCTKSVCEHDANEASQGRVVLNEKIIKRVQIVNDVQIVEIIPSLRYICAKAESHLESHWAEIISGSQNESEEEDSGRPFRTSS
jgi:nicotianamine synthase